MRVKAYEDLLSILAPGVKHRLDESDEVCTYEWRDVKGVQDHVLQQDSSQTSCFLPLVCAIGDGVAHNRGVAPVGGTASLQESWDEVVLGVQWETSFLRRGVDTDKALHSFVVVTGGA